MSRVFRVLAICIAAIVVPAQAAEPSIACLMNHLVLAHALGRACGLPLDAQSETRLRALRDAVETRDPERPSARDAFAEIEASVKEHADDPRLCHMARAYQRGLAEYTAGEGYAALLHRLEEPDAFKGACR
jgi:hypothetical protein